MTIGAVLILGGILLLNAAVRDENIATIISSILGNKPLGTIGNADMGVRNDGVPNSIAAPGNMGVGPDGIPNSIRKP